MTDHGPHRPTRPPEACHACWTTWCASTTAPAVGYCWHSQIAWRVKPSGEIETIAADRDEYHAMLHMTERRR